MSDILSYIQEAGQYSSYSDIVAQGKEQAKEQAKDLLSAGGETLAEGSPIIVDAFRNTAKLYQTGKKFYKALQTAAEKAKESGEKVATKGEELLQKGEAKLGEVRQQAEKGLSDIQAQAEKGVSQVKGLGEGLAEKVLPKEVEMKTFRSSVLEDVAPIKKPTTFTPKAASEQEQSKSLSDYLRQKADARLENRTKARMTQEAEADPEDLATRIQLSEVRSSAISDSVKAAAKEAIPAPETFEQVGQQAVERASQALKEGTQGIQAASEEAQAAGREALQVGKEAVTKAASAASEATEATTSLLKAGAEDVAKEAAATATDVALEAIPVVGEVLGTGALLYQGIKDLFTGSREKAPVAPTSAAPVFAPSIANPL